jgi:hypothetical protein
MTDLGTYISEPKAPPSCDEGQILVVGSQAYQCLQDGSWAAMLPRGEATGIALWGLLGGFVLCVLAQALFLGGLNLTEWWRDRRYRRKVKVVEW